MLIEKHETCNTIKLTPTDSLIITTSPTRVCSKLFVTKDCCSEPIELKLPLHLEFDIVSTWNVSANATQEHYFDYASFQWSIVDDDDIIESVFLNTTSPLEITKDSDNKYTQVVAASPLLGNTTILNTDIPNVTVTGLNSSVTITLKECGRKVNLLIYIPSTDLESWELGLTQTVTDLDVSEGISFTYTPSYKITLDPRVIGLLETDVFPDSVYNFLIEDTYKTGSTLTTRVEEASRFLECSTQCQVIDYIIKNPTSNLHMIYESLVYAHNCNFISFKELCELWNYLGLKLGFFTTDPCAEAIASDCNCN